MSRPIKEIQPLASDLSALFSSVVYRDLAVETPTIAWERLSRLAPLLHSAGASTIAEMFDAAHDRLQRDYRNEYVYKNAIVSKIIFARHRPTTATALLELPMGRSFADVAVFNGTSTVYEIKTDLDSFTRLQSQLSDYATRAEFVNVVVSESRVAAAEEHLPIGIGLLALRRSGALRTIRRAESNLAALDVDHLLRMLRQVELHQALREHCGWILGAPVGDLWYRARNEFSKLPRELVHQITVTALRARGRRIASLVIDPSFPPSIRALAYGTEISNAGATRLRARLASPCPS